MFTTPVRVALANDYALVVAGVAAVLAPYADRVQVVELAVNKPVIGDLDVVLYDTFGNPQGPACEAHRLRGGAVKLVVFSWNTEAAQVRASFEHGVDGYLAKGSTAEEIVRGIEAVHRGEWVGPQGVTAPGLAEAFGRWPGDEHGLSARESEVLALICQGLSNGEIAERAYLGINTVKTYIRSAYRKIDVATRPRAVIWGLSHGFAPDPARSIEPDSASSA